MRHNKHINIIYHLSLFVKNSMHTKEKRKRMNTCFPPHLPTISVRGLAFADTDPAGLQAWLSGRLTLPHPTVIFTPNAKIGADAQSHPHLHALLSQADILLPDGAGILLASRRHASRPLLHRLPGIEAAEMVLAIAAERSDPVYFLGGEEGVAHLAAAHWQESLPSLVVAGTHHGYFNTKQEQEGITQEIRQSGAKIVLVCLGFPAQEEWILQNRPALPSVRLFMGLGGSFDVWAGRLRRAPLPFRIWKMEWLWRMLRQPRRFVQLPAMMRYVFGK
jgi:N-acetylglucosaminyldiphosphoundecaprenol N-acetyl-beta-D-mannosaminyltransferase